MQLGRGSFRLISAGDGASCHPAYSSGMNLLGPTGTWSSCCIWKDFCHLLSAGDGAAKCHHLLSVTAALW